MCIPEPMSKTKLKFCYNFKCGFNNQGLCPYNEANIDNNGFCTRVVRGNYKGESMFKPTIPTVKNCNSLNCDYNENVECTRNEIRLGLAGRCMNRSIERID
jgi:hypothetical protein